MVPHAHPEPPVDSERAWLWPLAITLGLALVIAVNVAFIVIAVRGADAVAESYHSEAR